MISKVKMECIRKGVVWSFKKKPTGLDCIRRRAAAVGGGRRRQVAAAAHKRHLAVPGSIMSMKAKMHFSMTNDRSLGECACGVKSVNLSAKFDLG